MHGKHHSHRYLYAGVAATLALLAGCAKDTGQNITLGHYGMTLSTDPHPLQVGEDAEITARVQKPDDALDACRVAFRQYMPEHEMSGDTAWHAMGSLGKGLFRGRGDEFTMGGDWELEFKLDCKGDVQRATVPYTLEWPE